MVSWLLTVLKIRAFLGLAVALVNICQLPSKQLLAASSAKPTRRTGAGFGFDPLVSFPCKG